MGENKIKKITFVINSLNIGGTEKQLLCLINLIKKKYNISIFAFSSGGLFRKFKESGAELFICNNLFSAIKFIFFLIFNKTDIYHFFLPKSYLLGGFLTLFSSKKKIMSRRSLNNYHKKYFFISLILEKFLHRQMNLILTNTEAIKEQLITNESVSNDKVKVIPNFITSVGQRKKTKKKILRFIYVANFIPYKNHLVLLEICSKIKVENRWELILVGADVNGFKAVVRRKIKQLSLCEKIKIYDQRKDVDKVYTEIDFSVCPSSEEGSSNFLLESIHFGLPIIAFDVGGNSEFFDKNGFLIPAFDKKIMRKKIEFMLTKNLTKFSSNSIKVCRSKFNNKKNLRFYINAYED